MKLNRQKFSALATGVALGVATMAAQAADQPSIPTANTAAAGTTFTGGVTLNNSASFVPVVPPTEAFDFLATINPASSHIGQSASLYAIASAAGFGTLTLNDQGQWVAHDANNLTTFSSRTLSASEALTLVDDLVANDVGGAGVTLDITVGYVLDSDPSTRHETAVPISVDIAADPTGCPAGTTENAATYNGLPVCNIPTGTPIMSDMHLTNNNAYFFSGTVFVGDNDLISPADSEKVALHIDPGTNIISEGNQSALVITRGGKIYANGTAAKPIIMTSSQDDGTLDELNARGLWGGLTISGSATLNTSSGFDDGEGSTGQYGGGTSPNDADSSGAVTYLQLKYAGFPITQDDELNTISLQGVGSGTVLDYIHSHNGADDGIEFYGGTVNAKHIYISGADDDALDWTAGWTGKLQHVIVEQTTSGDNCIEADNLGGNPTATPRSNPTVSNMTCINSTGQKSSGHALELKAGTGGQMVNMVIGGTIESTEGCIVMGGDETFIQSGTTGNFNGTLVLENSLVTASCAESTATLDGTTAPTFTVAEWLAAQANTVLDQTADLGGTEGWTNGTTINSVTPAIPYDSFFDQVDYIGAVKDDASDWTQGWVFDFD